MNRIGLRLLVLAVVVCLVSALGCDDEVSCGSGVEQYAGIYDGTFSGDDQGTFTMTIAGCDVTGVGDSNQDGVFVITGVVDGSGDVVATFGSATTGATWQGTIDGDVVTGTWTNRLFGQSGTGRAVRR